jgi:hypothetical protein
VKRAERLFFQKLSSRALRSLHLRHGLRHYNRDTPTQPPPLLTLRRTISGTLCLGLTLLSVMRLDLTRHLRVAAELWRVLPLKRNILVRHCGISCHLVRLSSRGMDNDLAGQHSTGRRYEESPQSPVCTPILQQRRHRINLLGLLADSVPLSRR